MFKKTLLQKKNHNIKRNPKRNPKRILKKNTKKTFKQAFKKKPLKTTRRNQKVLKNKTI